MKPYDIALLFCRLLSIFLIGRFFEVLATGVLAAFTTLIFSRPLTGAWIAIAYLVVPLGFLGMSVVLWLGAPLIASSVARDVKFSPPATTAADSVQQWSAILRGLLGLFFIIQGVSGCGAGLIGLVLTGNGIVRYQTGEFGMDRAVTASLQLVLGLILLFHASRAARDYSKTKILQSQKVTGV